jgi:hypothetical protein
MHSLHRSLVLGGCALALLSACGVSSYGTSSGTIPSTSGTTGTGGTGGGTGGLAGGGDNGIAGTHDSIVATVPSNMVSVVVGAKVTVPVTFTSSDGRSITGFALSNSLGATLPAGWTGPATFACPTVSTGSGCVLNLVYQPTAYTTPQTVTLNYLFIDNSNEPVTSGSISFNYQATTNDNVIATSAPAGQINATIGTGTQTVTVTYATDDAHPAANLSVTGTVPAALPAGWSGPTASTCATVSAGTACTMAWTYTPAAPDSGVITVDFAYDNDSATAKTGSFNIPYAATANNNILGMVSPSAPINVTGPGPQTVTVTFYTDDTFLASNLMITTDLSTLSVLNPGWSSASPTFSCVSVSTPSTSCQLSLSYAPAAPGDNSVLQLQYTYKDNAGTAKQASVNIPYTSS